jgi:hypothetical protein
MLASDIITDLAGDPTNLNLKPNTLTQAAASGESNVELYTHKSGWTNSYKYYESARMAGYLFALAFIRSGNDETEQKQRQEFETAVQICTKLSERLAAEGLLVSPTGTSLELTDGFNYATYPGEDTVVLSGGVYNTGYEYESAFYP